MSLSHMSPVSKDRHMTNDHLYRPAVVCMRGAVDVVMPHVPYRLKHCRSKLFYLERKNDILLL